MTRRSKEQTQKPRKGLGRPRHRGRRKPLWRLSLTIAPESEDAVTELLGRILDQPLSSYTDREAGVSTVSAFLPSREIWSETTREKLRVGLRLIQDCELPINPGRISFRKVPSRDWTKAWKHHFKPFRVGTRLLVRPSWSRPRVDRGQRVVVIDPGLSFGTGHHPTTRFCLKELVGFRRYGRHQSFLDLGTGSGILAVAGAKLGYAPVTALDIDPDAVRVARENARRNGLIGRIEFRQKDITQWSVKSVGRYSVICANLITPLLISELNRIAARLEKDGLLVLAGILNQEFGLIRAACENIGLRLRRCTVEKEWCSGSFDKLNDVP